MNRVTAVRPTAPAPGARKPAPEPEGVMMLSRSLRVLLAGIYLWVGVAFCYLYRKHGGFPIESALWLAWTALCFAPSLRAGIGPVTRLRGLSVAVVGLALFQIFLIDWFRYSLLPWVTVSLLVVVGARAENMRTHRDLHLALVAVFVASLMIATHLRADWSLWFYLVPAWFLAMALLVWEHTDTEGLGWRTRLGASVAVTLFAATLSAGLLAVIPRPDVVELGMIPSEARGGHTGPERSPQEQGAAQSGTGGASEPGSTGVEGVSMGALGSLLELRQSLDRDPHMPAWQASLLRATLTGLAAALPLLAQVLPVLLAALLAAFLGRWILRRLRPHLERLAVEALFVVALVLATRWPMASCRCTAYALGRALDAHGLPRQPGESVQEHFGRSHLISRAAYSWALSVARRYGMLRFSSVRATPEAARTLEFEAASACEALWRAPRARRITSPSCPSVRSPG